MPTMRTAFGRWVPLVDLGKRPSVPRCLVLKLTNELTPANITDGFCEVMVLDHVLDGKTLDAYCLEPCLGAGIERMMRVESWCW